MQHIGLGFNITNVQIQRTKEERARLGQIASFCRDLGCNEQKLEEMIKNPNKPFLQIITFRTLNEGKTEVVSGKELQYFRGFSNYDAFCFMNKEYEETKKGSPLLPFVLRSMEENGAIVLSNSGNARKVELAHDDWQCCPDSNGADFVMHRQLLNLSAKMRKIATHNTYGTNSENKNMK